MLGGNEERTFEVMNIAKVLINQEVGKIFKASSVYQTAAWGPIVQPDYLNQAILVFSPLPPRFLLKKILSIELQLGRKRIVKYGPRTIDIDILFYGEEFIHTKDLIVPHPEIQNRKFVLLPCMELIPGLKHPVLSETVRELLHKCKDELEVRKWKD